MTRRISVLLADDHTLFREMLSERLAREADIEVCDCVETAQRAVAIAAARKPTIALLDISMPGLSAFDGAELIRDASPATRVVFLSGFVKDVFIQRALDAGASGYLLKTEDQDTLLRSLHAVAGGGSCFSEAVRRRIVIGATGVSLLDTRASRGSLLTPRERQVLRHLADGLSKKAIAKDLRISEKTADHHCSNIMIKLDIHDRVALARFAVREGLVPP